MCKIFLFLSILLTSQVVLFSSTLSSARGRNGMVVSAHRLASEVGVEILKKGGNAADAAVAVAFALAVVFPEAGNIGGGGFMLIRKQDGTATVIDFRETAPKAVWRDMYLDSTGEVTDKAVRGHLSVGVPGTVAGIIKALESFGSMKLPEVIDPAIHYAEEGFVVDQNLENNLKEYEKDLIKYPSTVKIFFKDGKPYVEGDTLRQPDLASTLRRIKEKGADDFYRGETAQLIVREMKEGGGLITSDDLKNYYPIVREPIRSSYRDYEIISTPLPSSGGLCLAEMLTMLENVNLATMGYHSSQVVHIIAEVMKRVYADRAEYMGDPAFVRVSEDVLISKDYASRRFTEIDLSKATPSNAIKAGNVFEHQHTTHYSIVDKNGMCVAVTYTINDLFGSQVVVDGAGFFLNNEMDDFSSKSGVPNSYGLIGGFANAIEAKKRPLSSMTPTIVLKENKPIMILGARGGSKIITSVLQTIINVIDYGMDIQKAIEAPRFHHQWTPDELIFEKYCLPLDVIENLEKKGHVLRETNSSIGELEAIFIDQSTGWIYGAPDSREGGTALGH